MFILSENSYVPQRLNAAFRNTSENDASASDEIDIDHGASLCILAYFFGFFTLEVFGHMA